MNAHQLRRSARACVVAATTLLVALGASGCQSTLTCPANALVPEVLLTVKGDFPAVAEARVCAASTTRCAPTEMVTDTGATVGQPEASAVPGTWRLPLTTGTSSPLRVQLLDKSGAMLLDQSAAVTWQKQRQDECHVLEYADVTVTLSAPAAK